MKGSFSAYRLCPVVLDSLARLELKQPQFHAGWRREQPQNYGGYRWVGGRQALQFVARLEPRNRAANLLIAAP
ncbi:MAG: hypothetical protein ACRD3O_10875 [Terriglobia bacterium]